jgi:hypothetical protein
VLPTGGIRSHFVANKTWETDRSSFIFKGPTARNKVTWRYTHTYIYKCCLNSATLFVVVDWRCMCYIGNGKDVWKEEFMDYVNVRLLRLPLGTEDNQDSRFRGRDSTVESSKHDEKSLLMAITGARKRKSTRHFSDCVFRKGLSQESLAVHTVQRCLCREA